MDNGTQIKVRITDHKGDMICPATVIMEDYIGCMFRTLVELPDCTQVWVTSDQIICRTPTYEDVKKHVLMAIDASGPMSFASLINECITQTIGFEEQQKSRQAEMMDSVLNDMIKEGVLMLDTQYDERHGDGHCMEFQIWFARR